MSLLCCCLVWAVVLVKCKAEERVRVLQGALTAPKPTPSVKALPYEHWVVSDPAPILAAVFGAPSSQETDHGHSTHPPLPTPAASAPPRPCPALALRIHAGP